MTTARSLSVAVRLARTLTACEASLLDSFADAHTVTLNEITTRLEAPLNDTSAIVSSLEARGLVTSRSGRGMPATVTITGLGECVLLQYKMWEQSDSLSQ